MNRIVALLVLASGFQAGAAELACPKPQAVIVDCQPIRTPPTEKKPDEKKPDEKPTTQPASRDDDRAPDFSQERFAAGQGEGFAAASTAVGYIDPALPVTMFRFRFDSAWDSNRPDRAEYFYPKQGLAPDANGPFRFSSNVDYQEVSAYFEYAFTRRASAFIDIPVRFMNADNYPFQGGLSDVMAGFKYAFQFQKGKVTTFQTKIYTPTGSGGRGLGTEHASIEPGILFYRQVGRRAGIEGEFKDWIPIGGSDFAGSVLQYGLGFGGTLYDTGSFRIIPITEWVGWTVLNGQETVVEPNAIGVISAKGDTILNAKFGTRFGFGKLIDNSFISKSDLYVGYGRALTGDVWYQDLLRVEFRVAY